MAGDWIKMRCDLWTDPRVVRISSALKADKVRTIGALFWLWGIADAHSADGTLPGYTAEVVDSETGIAGFAAELHKVGWLDVSPEGVSIPRFAEHNGRSAKRRAQDAVRKNSVRKMSALQADKMRTREEKRREDNKQENKQKKSEGPQGAPGADVRLVFDHYRTYHPRAHRKPKATSKECRLIKARLDEGYSVDDLTAAIDGCHRSPFHQGDNDRGKKFDSLELIVRDGSKVQQFMEIPAKGSVTHGNPTTGRIHTPGYQVPDRSFKPTTGTPPGGNVPARPGPTPAEDSVDP